MKKCISIPFAGLFLVLCGSLFFSCDEPDKPLEQMVPIPDHEGNCRIIMEHHLRAIKEKNLKMLESTLSPTGEMQLILPSAEIEYGTDYFMEMHEVWFADTTWSYEAEILTLEANDGFGFATTEAVYSEPERDGVPYFNRLAVTYTLKLIDNRWCVVSDHASSMEKSTDSEE